MKIVLASRSTYRKELLARLGISFSCVAPPINEEELKRQFETAKISPVTVAENLSYQKGYSVFSECTEDTLVISGDQLVAFEGQVLGKPATAENAFAQLSLLNGKTHQLITAITVLSPSGIVKYNHISELKMKTLSPAELQRCIDLDQPFDCSGSYKIEKHGITLFETIDCDDFTAIQGIPLLWLSNHLKGDGYEFFTS